MSDVRYECNKLHENLLIGGAPPGGSLLADHGIKVLVLCAHEHQNELFYPGVTVIKAPGSDADPMRAHDADIWSQAAKEVAAHVRQGDLVLVTCMMGQNRSGFVCAAALNDLTGQSGDVCIKHIQQYRQNALWNKAFVSWLTENLKKKEE